MSAFLPAPASLRCVAVVPTYDEASTILALLDRLASVRGGPGAPHLDVLVVDDSSPDGTGDLVRAHPGHGDWLHLVTRVAKGGLGAAYRAGFSYAVDDGYHAVIQLDADGSHPVEEIPAMLGLLADHDVVIGSRYVPGGGAEGWPVRRRVLSLGANTYARRALRLRTHDATSGFRAWRVGALLRCDVLRTESNGYGFQVENTWHAERRGLRVVEHPITFTERVSGASKMTVDVAREAAVLVARWRWAELRAAHPALRPAAPPHTP